MNKNVLTSTKTLILGCLVLLSLSACNSAPDIAGSWRADAANLVVPDAFSSTIADNVTFTTMPHDNKMGQVSISSLISLQVHQGNVNAVEGPYQATIAATATIQGNWTYDRREADEINVSLDYSTLNVVIDPESVVFTDATPFGSEKAVVDSIRPAIVQQWTNRLIQPISQHYARYSEIEDIDVTKNMLKCELEGANSNDIHVTFYRTE